MRSNTGYWKLGLFVIIGLFSAFGTVVWLGAAELDKEVAYYVTYFDESVQGLDTGSPVKFRGVTIGNVHRIGIAPDHRLVEVTCEIDLRLMRNLGLDSKTLQLPKDLRIQLASAGVTGLKFLQVDFFDVNKYPPPKRCPKGEPKPIGCLDFEPPDNYVPAVSSTLKSLEDAVVRSVGRFPEATGEAIETLKRVNVLLDDINSKKFPDQATDTLERVNGTLDEGQKLLRLAQWKVHQVDVKTMNDNLVKLSENLVILSENLIGTSHKADLALDNVNGTLIRTNTLLMRIQKNDGLLSDVEATVKILRTEAANLEGTMAIVKGTMSSVRVSADAFSDVARNTSSVTDELGGTLASVKEAAESIRRVADVLERDPDMLLKGRAEAGK